MLTRLIGPVAGGINLEIFFPLGNRQVPLLGLFMRNRQIVEGGGALLIAELFLYKRVKVFKLIIRLTR